MQKLNFVGGEQESVWFVDNVKKYHRMFSSIVNTLTNEVFTIEKMSFKGGDNPAFKDKFKA